MEYYIIACISFSMMYLINYGIEIINTVTDVLYMLDINYREEDTNWTPLGYAISMLITVATFMPLFLYLIVTTDKYAIIKNATAGILTNRFGLERDE